MAEQQQSTSESTTTLMGNLFAWALNQAKVHGAVFVAMLFIIVYFYVENTRIRTEIRACNDSLIDMYRTDREQLLDVINNNTRALDIITRQYQLSPLNQSILWSPSPIAYLNTAPQKSIPSGSLYGRYPRISRSELCHDGSIAIKIW